MDRIQKKQRIALNRAGIHTVNQLVQLDVDQLLAIRGIGVRTIPHVNEIRTELGLRPLVVPTVKYNRTDADRQRISEGVKRANARSRAHKVWHKAKSKGSFVLALCHFIYRTSLIAFPIILFTSAIITLNFTCFSK